MERIEFEEKVEEIKQTQDYFVVYVYPVVIYAEDYSIGTVHNHEKIYLYCCTYLIAEVYLEDVNVVDYS